MYYQKELRLIEFYDEETDKELVFLTNNTNLAASMIALLRTEGADRHPYVETGATMRRSG